MKFIRALMVAMTLNCCLFSNSLQAVWWLDLSTREFLENYFKSKCCKCDQYIKSKRSEIRCFHGRVFHKTCLQQESQEDQDGELLCQDFCGTDPAHEAYQQALDVLDAQNSPSCSGLKLSFAAVLGLLAAGVMYGAHSLDQFIAENGLPAGFDRLLRDNDLAEE